jgi:hypothetical protein
MERTEDTEKGRRWSHKDTKITKKDAKDGFPVLFVFFVTLWFDRL